MNDNVIDFRAGKPVEQVKQEAVQANEAVKQRIVETNEAERVKQLEELDKIRDLINRGVLEGFVLIARAPGPSVFLTEMALPGANTATELMAYIGAIECIKLELTEKCQLLPQMLNDGSIVATQEIVESLL